MAMVKLFLGLVVAVALFLFAVPPVLAQEGDYGVRIPSKIPGCYAPVGSRLLGSHEQDHTDRNSPTLAWDWSASVGSPVFSICPGVVRTTSNNNRGGYGSYVIIDHGNRLSTLYAHCITNSFTVKPGQTVDATTQICSVGMTGMTSWPHVHLNIDINGVHQPVGNYFDRSLVRYCHFTRCRANNDPKAPVSMGSQVLSQQPATVGQTATQVVQTESAGIKLFRQVLALPSDQLALGVWLLIIGVMFLGWVGGVYVRAALVAAVVTVVVAGCMFYLFLPSTAVQATQAVQQPAPVGGDWEKAYQIVQGNEGWKCTEDGAHTMGGVTQGTYNRWRAKHGMGSADVCRNLTREQAKQVFYELFWLPSGAASMPFALGLTVVDHYYNTGKVSHLLAQCGQNVACFNQARIADYRTMKMCPVVINKRGDTYCTAWINRVNKIRKYTGG